MNNPFFTGHSQYSTWNLIRGRVERKYSIGIALSIFNGIDSLLHASLSKPVHIVFCQYAAAKAPRTRTRTQRCAAHVHRDKTPKHLL